MVDAFRFQKHAGWSSEVLCRKVFPMSPEHHLPTNPPGKGTKISPFILRLLTPALSSFGEERENAGATFVVHGHNARMPRGILTPSLFPTSWRKGRRIAAVLVRFCLRFRIFSTKQFGCSEL